MYYLLSYSILKVLGKSKRQIEIERREYLESLSLEEQIQHDSRGSDFVIVNGSVFPITDDGSGGIIVMNNVTGDILHHQDDKGNVTIFSDPLAGSSTVVPINYEYNLYDERPLTGSTISASTFSSRRNSGVGGVSSRRNSGVGGANSRRNSGVGGANSRRDSRGSSGANWESYLDNLSRRNDCVIIPDIISITSRSRRNSKDREIVEAEAELVNSKIDDDDKKDDEESDNENDYYD